MPVSPPGPDRDEPHADVAGLSADAERARREGRRADARRLYADVLRLDPRHAVALRHSAWLADEAGDAHGAIALLRRLLAVEPNDARAHQDIALCLLRLGRRDEAIVELRRTVALAPDYAPGHCNLGLALEEAGDFTGAAAALREALRLQPDSSFIAYHLGAVAAQAGDPSATLPTCPPGYLVQLFDDYADRFDRHLFHDLGYRGPALLAAAVAAAAPHAPPTPWDVLDLGCGTGMTAVPFRGAARRVVGVDLAPRMLRLAAARVTPDGRRAYDELLQSDLVPALRANPAQFDLILSADVFIYVGDLRDVFPAARDALRPGGLFAFTIETWDGPDDYRLLPTRRYAQSPAYIERIAREAGLRELLRRPVDLRRGDDGRAVKGAVFLLQRPAGS